MPVDTLIETPLGNFTWVENWATIPDTQQGRDNGRTHAAVTTKQGDVVVFHQAVPAVLIYDEAGQLKTSWGEFPGAHGMTIIEQGGVEYLWLADQARKLVGKYTLDGEEVMVIDAPEHAVYTDEGRNYIPTWAAENPENGDIWVADGYGGHVVHRYDKAGNLQMTLTGEEGAGRMSEPHGINFTQGSEGLELWSADRCNHRVVVYDAEGKFLRSTENSHSACCFDFQGDHVLIPELFSGVKIMNKSDFSVITEFGKSDRVRRRDDGAWWPPVAPEGWPNLAGTDHIQPGMFSSPHGGCFAPNGDIYVTEWIVGGRITKLEKVNR